MALLLAVTNRVFYSRSFPPAEFIPRPRAGASRGIATGKAEHSAPKPTPARIEVANRRGISERTGWVIPRQIILQHKSRRGERATHDDYD